MTTTSPLVTGVDFVTVPTDAFDAAVEFYGNVLGLPCIERYGKMPGAEFQAGNLTLAVMDPTAFGQEFRPNAMPIAFQVDDVEEARAKLVEAGVEFKTGTFDSGSVARRYSSTRPGTPWICTTRYAPPKPGGAAA